MAGRKEQQKDSSTRDGQNLDTDEPLDIPLTIVPDSHTPFPPARAVEHEQERTGRTPRPQPARLRRLLMLSVMFLFLLLFLFLFLLLLLRRFPILFMPVALIPCQFLGLAPFRFAYQFLLLFPFPFLVFGVLHYLFVSLCVSLCVLLVWFHFNFQCFCVSVSVGHKARRWGYNPFRIYWGL